MTLDQRREPFCYAVALIIVTAAVTAAVQNYEAVLVARLDSMSAVAYIDAQRHLHAQPYFTRFVFYLFGGALYLRVVESIASWLRRWWFPARQQTPNPGL